MVVIGRVSRQGDRLVIYLPKECELSHREDVAVIRLSSILSELQEKLKEGIQKND